VSSSKSICYFNMPTTMATTTKDDYQRKSIPDNQLSADTSQSTIRSRDDYRQLSSSPTTMKSNRKTINLQRKNRRATFNDNRKSTRQFTYYLLTSTHNVNKHGRRRRSAINIRQLSAIKNTTPHNQRLQVNTEKEQKRGDKMAGVPLSQATAA